MYTILHGTNQKSLGRAEMNALVCSGSKPLCLEGSATWMKRRHRQHPKTIHRPYNHTQRQYGKRGVKPPHGSGKGFSVSVASQSGRREKEKRASKDNDGNEDDDAIPEVVFERMLGRIVFFVVTPMAMGLGVVYLFGVFKEQHLWEAPVWLQLLIITLAFGTSSLGLGYGTLSTNWDPDRKGTLLGWEEARKNWPELWNDSSARKR